MDAATICAASAVAQPAIMVAAVGYEYGDA
jgi:hypothetical protein